MITPLKHIIFKYLLLVFLSLKVGILISDNITCFNNCTHETSICCQTDLDDFENENDKKEFDENQQIYQMVTLPLFYKSDIPLKNHFSIVKNYRDFHFEFTPPPPQAV
ncbi:hypothetical protein TMP248_170027 [Tenacibaculum maritimum]|nr:hypothetical protein TMP248_170027 [Tenacibaculum maritimum]